MTSRIHAISLYLWFWPQDYRRARKYQARHRKPVPKSWLHRLRKHEDPVAV